MNPKEQSLTPNSASENAGGAIGVSRFFRDGFAGVSYSLFDSNYGTVSEDSVVIDMRSTRWDASTEFRDIGTVVEKLKFRIGYTEYKHKEVDDGEVGTIFMNDGV